MAVAYTPIPLYSSPQPGFSMLDTLNGLIEQINANFQSGVGPENAPSLPWATGQFYGLPRGCTPSTLLTTVSTIYAYPLYIPGNVAIKAISLDSTTGQTGGAGHVGIYADNGGAPGALVTGSDSGALAATSTAIATKTYSSPLSLSPGWYWLASTFTASSTMPTVGALASAYTNEVNAEQGNASSLANLFATSAQNVLGVTAAFTYAALPATFPTASYAQNVATAIPMVGLST